MLRYPVVLGVVLLNFIILLHVRADSQLNAQCIECHESSGIDQTVFLKSVHGDLSCIECHSGYDVSKHATKPIPAPEGKSVLVAKLGTKSKAPLALLSCDKCHPDVIEQLSLSIHSTWLRENLPAAGPICSDCHGSTHNIEKSGTRNERNYSKLNRCAACHKQNSEVVPTYYDSVHGRLISIGSNKAPACHDCHGSHNILAAASIDSPVSPQNKARTCAKCHTGADNRFAAVITHKPVAHGSHPGPHWTHVFFSYLTTLTLLGLSGHIALDFSSEIRMRFRRRKRETHDKTLFIGMPQSVVRLDIHQRIQHWLLIASVILLVLTGWPLRAALLGPSRSLVALFGGPHGAAIVHRFAAFLLIFAAIYHLVYLTVIAFKGKLRFSMMPTFKDVTDLFQNLTFFIGLRHERPRFGKFSYVEKFDYWAVFWGTAIMVGTGFIYWFPVQFSAWIPSWVINAAQLAHGEEATLAALALFVWHFYNVHMRPSIFPMNWAWLNGRISTEMLYEEHRLEYEKLKKNN